MQAARRAGKTILPVEQRTFTGYLPGAWWEKSSKSIASHHPDLQRRTLPPHAA